MMTDARQEPSRVIYAQKERDECRGDEFGNVATKIEKKSISDRTSVLSDFNELRHYIS